MGVKIDVVGFDCGDVGLPELVSDYRDHPDRWKSGDYPMDVDALTCRLGDSTNLILGRVEDTVDDFVLQRQQSPLGFVAIDLDLYSSTKSALRVLSHKGRTLLRQVVLYFDDIEFIFNHKYAGELLAIEEFNQANASVKIDKWYGLRSGRPFPERSFYDQMYVTHDLDSISATKLERCERRLAL